MSPEERNARAVTQRIQSISEMAARAADQDRKRPHSHYFKDVTHLTSVDVYRLLRLFEVTDPCLQHAVKKLLCAGQRGDKGLRQDVEEAIVSLNRFLEMDDEDSPF